MNIQELTELANEAAAELSTTRGETWIIEDARDQDPHPQLVLAEQGGTGARLRIIYSWFQPGKVTAEALYPEGVSGGPRIRANIDPERGGPAIGRAIDRRVLRGGYLDALPKMLERKARQDAIQAAEAERLGQAADLFGIQPTGDKVYVGEFVEGSGYVEMWTASHPDTMSLSITGIPADVALEMLAVLARRGKA